MTYGYDIGDGAHGVDQQIQLDWARGYQVVDAAGGSNLVGDGGTADLTIHAAAGDINAGGTTVTCAQETVDLSGIVDPDNPRKVTVYRDATGTLNYEAGVAEPAQPSGAVRRDAYRPAPPTLSGTDAVILATVWVGAGASSIASGDIRDRRMPAEINGTTLGGNVDAQGNDITGVGSFSTEEASIAGRPYRSSSDTSIYIDEQNGSDSNGGTSTNDAFATWSRAEKEIPYFIHHLYTIRIVGDLNEEINLQNRNVQKGAGGPGIIIRGHTETPSNHQVPNVKINGCTGRIDIRHLQNTSDSMFIRRCQSVEIRYCEHRTDTNTEGTQFNESIGFVVECDFGSNDNRRAIYANNSRVHSVDNTGNVSGFALVASRAATIGKQGTQPTGDSGDESAFQGGVIRA